ncbi:MAG: sulfatase-like hydrolase/transferase [Lentisphaeria bacterium]|nr:sulfatase-like hydrolase/transferase [Lentisphaeria bacterium]
MSVATESRPNILFILTDDQRHDTIGALGNPHIHTPNLDTLAENGFAFYKHFCTTPICTPARAEVLTGCNSFTNGVPWFGMPIEPGLELLPQAFQNAGYHTIHVGKWHNDGHPRDKGYDQVRCVMDDSLLPRPIHGHTMRFGEPDGEFQGHSTEVFTDAAIRALQEVPGDRPWFCYLGYHAPHDPHECPEPFASMYDPAKIPLYPNYMPEHPFDNGDMTIRDEQLENWPRTQEAMRRYRARYYGIISHLDWNVGRLVGRLRTLGCLENTIIVFTGDQGLATGSHGLLGKENMYDHSIASPLILSGPGLPEGGRSNALSHHVDLFPTLCELAGIPCPESARDGFSLLPVLRGEQERVRDAVLCEFYSPEEPGQAMRHTQRAVRTERWKLTWFPHIGRFQLFDVQEDSCELIDLLVPWRVRRRRAEAAGGKLWAKNKWAAHDLRVPYTQEEIERVVKDLHKRMLDMMREQNDPIPESQLPPTPLPSQEGTCTPHGV